MDDEKSYSNDAKFLTKQEKDLENTWRRIEFSTIEKHDWIEDPSCRYRASNSTVIPIISFNDQSPS